MRNLITRLMSETAGSALAVACKANKFCEVGFTDYVAQGVLNYVTGYNAIFALSTVFLALFTGVGTDSGAGFTEVSGNNYSRVQVSGSATTNNTTASGNNTLHFASTPAWITAGMSIVDTTTGSAIPGGTTVLSTTGTTVVMSANATGGGVGNGDNIIFSAFQAASGSGPSTISNLATITFPTPTVTGWGTVIAFGLYDAVSSGNLLAWDYLGPYSWQPCSVSAASPGVLTAHAHGFSAADTVVFTTEFGGTTPTFSQSNFTGLLAVVSPTTDTFTVTNASTAVNTSTTGNGMVRKVQVQPIAQNVVASFAGGSPGVLQIALV